MKECQCSWCLGDESTSTKEGEVSTVQGFPLFRCAFQSEHNGHGISMVFHIFRWFFQHEGLASAVSRSQGDDHRGTVSNDRFRNGDVFVAQDRAERIHELCCEVETKRCHDVPCKWCKWYKLKGFFGCKTRKSWRELAKGGSVDWCLFQDMDCVKKC